MEKKTIGTFIAALRKADGLTQRELAEKLNVSDKAVSRWERDESLPDLSMIPVIAELFHVTADELLCGERLYDDSRRGKAAEKSERQMGNLLDRVRLGLLKQSICAGGIAFAGLLSAMIGNFGFYRAYIGFFCACIFYMAAVVFEIVGMVTAFFAVGREFEGEPVNSCKKSLIHYGLAVFSLVIVLLSVSLPLVVLPRDSYVGLSAYTWLVYGAAFGAAGIVVSVLIGWCVKAVAGKRRIYSLSEEERGRDRLKKRCCVFTAGVMLLTLLLHIVCSEATLFTRPIVFDSLEAFERFIESVNENAEAENSVCYDESGNPISRERAAMREIRNRQGELIFRYYDYSNAVAQVRSSDTDDGLPISVITMEEMNRGQQVRNTVIRCFFPAYLVEAAAGGLIYIRRRKHI